MTTGSGFTLTARTSALVVTALSGDFTTTSNGTYVDVTGLTYSVPANHFVSARYDATKSTAGTGSCRLVRGAGPTVVQTSGTIGTARKTKAFRVYQNTSGSAETWKVQAQSTADTNTWTVHKDASTSPPDQESAASILVCSPLAIENVKVTGNIEMNIKANYTTLQAITFSINPVIVGPGSVPGEGTSATSIPISNLMDGFTIQSTLLVYVEGGASVNTSTSALFFDFTGDNVTLS